MATNYTSLLGFALPTTGELSGTWGTVVNDNITELVEDAIAATATQSVASADWTLSTTGSGAANQARCAIIIPTGSPGVSRNIIAPGQSKAYVVINESDANIVFKASATTGITMSSGEKAVVAWNGSDFIKVGGSTPAGGSNTQVQYNSSGSFAGSANLTFDGTTLTAAGLSGPLTSSQVDITAQGDLRLQDSSGGQYVALQAPATIASSFTLTLPDNDGDASQVLTTDGAGVLSWTTPAGGVSLSADNTWTGLQSFTGTTSKLSSYFTNAKEKVTVSATAATGTIAYDVTTQSVLYYTTNASANWTVNFRASSGTSLDSAMSTGESVTVAFLVTQGVTPYYNSAVQVDGSSVTPKWQGGSAPTFGNASSIDAYVYTIIKTGAATFTVFASQTQFA